MIDDRELLERALRRFEPEPGLSERVMRRRDRKRRNQRIRAGALGVFVVLAFAIAASQALLQGAEPQRSTDPTVPAQTGDQRSIYLWDPNTATATLLHQGSDRPSDAELSPDGERVVYQGLAFDVVPQIFLLDADGEVRQLTDLELGAWDPTWSPDGTQIAFASRSGDDNGKDIFVMDADGTDIRRLVGTPDDDQHPDWSPDGKYIAFDGISDRGLQNRRIWVASVDTLEVTQISPIDRNEGAAHPAWSPDGRWIAHIRFAPWMTVNSRLLESYVWIMRADGSEGRMVWKEGSQVALSPTWSPDGDAILFSVGTGPGFYASFAGRSIAIDPGSGRTVTVSDATVDVNASWSSDGILMILRDEDDTPSAEPLPPEFQVDFDAE